MTLRTKWRTEFHLVQIKEKMHWLKDTDYIVIVKPGYKLKTLRSLGFVVHTIKITDPYNEYGFYKSFNNIPEIFRTITIKSKEQLNYLKLSCPDAIKDYAESSSIIRGMGLYIC